MENHTDLNDVQQSYVEFPNFGFNSFPTDTYQSVPYSAYSQGISTSEQPINQQDVTYDSYLSQSPSNDNWNHQDHVNHVSLDNDDLFSSLENFQHRSVGEQSSLGTYPEYSMVTETPAIAAPSELGEQPGHRPELRCSFPECSQDLKFPSESVLRKHETKHSKPYICQVPNCRYTRFGDKGGLDRHNREVHGSQTYCCPISSCKRHIRGFPRKYNLVEHQKRCHSSYSPDLTLPCVSRQQSQKGDSTKLHQESYDERSSSDMVTTRDGRRLRERLENLCKTRSEIDIDIEALKRSLELLGEDSP